MHGMNMQDSIEKKHGIYVSLLFYYGRVVQQKFYVEICIKQYIYAYLCFV